MLFLFMSSMASPVFAQQCTTNGGNWTNAASWTCTGGAVAPPSGAFAGTLTVLGTIAVNADITITGSTTINVPNGGQIDMGSNRILTLSNNTSIIDLFDPAALIDGGSANSKIVIGTAPTSFTYGPFNGINGLTGPQILSNGGFKLSLTTTTSSTAVCLGTSVALSVSVTGGMPPNSFTWTGPAGTTVSPTSASVVSATIGTAGPQTFTVVVTDGVGSSAVTTVTVTGVAAPATPTIAASRTAICTGQSATLTATSSGATSYTWSPSPSSGQSTSIAVVTVAGSYSVLVSNAAGCTATASVVISSPPALLISQIVSTSTNCGGSPTGTISVTGSGGTPSGTPAYTFVLNPGGTTINSSTLATFSSLSAGSYTVTITDANGCTASAAISVTGSGAAPTPTASSSVVCQGDMVSVGSVFVGPVTSYQWYQNGQSLGAAQQGPTLALGNVQSVQAGSYVLVISGVCGSLASTAFALTVNPLPTVVITFPNSATVVDPSSVPTIVVPLPIMAAVSGGVWYDWVLVIDRINGYEIRQTTQNATGLIPVSQAGPYTLTVTGANGCKRTVRGIIVNQ